MHNKRHRLQVKELLFKERPDIATCKSLNQYDWKSLFTEKNPQKGASSKINEGF